jgi:predicted transposase/invertase (TIGR01784 family)
MIDPPQPTPSVPPDPLPAAPSVEEARDPYITEIIAHPHDAFFRHSLSDPRRAALFFQGHLPPAIVDLIQWETLKPEPTSFIKSTLQDAQSDLLFSVAQRTGELLYLYIIFEHQTTVDKWMRLRLLGYELELWNRLIQQNPAPKHLPITIPFVLHQGPDRWTPSTEFHDLFGSVPEAFRVYLPSFTHSLLDLTRTRPEADESDPELQTILYLMKLAREKDQILTFLRWLAQQEEQLADHLIRLCLTYALYGNSKLDITQLIHSLPNNPRLNNDIMTTAQRLLEEGEARGEIRGKALGTIRGKIEMLESLLDEETTAPAVLDAMELPSLEAHFLDQQRRYDLKFKRR